MSAADPLRYFRVEARELIDQISAGVLDLGQRPGHERVARLLRTAHTLKGAARVVRQQVIAEHAHEFEEVLVGHRGDDAPLPADEMRELLRLNDQLEMRVAEMEPSGPAAVPAPAADAAAAGVPGPVLPSANPADNAPAVRTATSDVDELLDAIAEAHARFAPLRGSSKALTGLHRNTDALVDQLRIGARTSSAETTRAVSARLSSDFTRLARRLDDTVEQVERELDQIRGRAERLRLVAASTIFTALHRVARDAADAEGNRVHFEGRGGDLRLDPQVLSMVSAAFRHVVRNAVVHGIESEDERVAAGKPPEGRIVVSVERRGRLAAFRCADDGRGFDLAAIRRSAEARGLLTPGQTESGEQALLNLILRGGISTAATVTGVAGRGIGLDVVRDVAAQLGGDVAVDTQPGRGATVELVVPLALLSLNGLMVQAAGTAAMVPLDAVHTCVRLLPDQAVSATVTGRFSFDGEALPFLPLDRALQTGAAAPGGSGVVVIVFADSRRVAIGVDRLTGTSALVVHPLPELSSAAAVIGGVSMDLDGTPMLVLDPAGLVTETLRLGGTARAAVAEPQRRLPILVIDDSLTTRMVERSILESAGYEVEVAASGAEGLAKARAGEYLLYLSDVDMPGLDGFAFVTETRADPALSHVPAILVSSRDDPADRRRGLDAGAGAYVVKGEFDQQALLAHIRRLVGR
jgi:two-component system chemotaxis sensor kinase CheA